MAISEIQRVEISSNFIFNWFVENDIFSEDNLAPPVEDEDINLINEIYGGAFPIGVETIYRIHNGQTGWAAGMFGGYQFLPIEGILEFQSLAAEFSGDLTMDLSADSKIPGEILPVSFHPDRICFAGSGNGNFLAVDLHPGKNGNVGQIITCGRDTHVMEVISPSFPEFLEKFSRLLEHGHLRPVYDELGWRLDGAPYQNIVEVLTSIS